jgi:hypothetical protein
MRNSFESGCRIFRFDGNAWLPVSQDLVGKKAGDYLGVSISLSGSGSTVAIGASQDDNSGPGYVQVYALEGALWLRNI